MGSAGAVRTMPSTKLCRVAVIILASFSLGQSRAKDAGRQKPAVNLQVARGEEIYDAECAICHYSRSALKKIGPGLKGLTARGKFADGRKVDDEGLRRWIENGGKDMPGFRQTLNAEKIRELIAYLKTL